MKKRVIAAVLACVMGVGLLTGCGSTAESSAAGSVSDTEKIKQQYNNDYNDFNKHIRHGDDF